MPKVSYINDEAKFRWDLLEEEMAFDKLHEGIKKFAEDGETLKGLCNIIKRKVRNWDLRPLTRHQVRERLHFFNDRRL